MASIKQRLAAIAIEVLQASWRPTRLVGMEARENGAGDGRLMGKS